VYPSLDEPRVRDEAARKLRGSLATYRGRALNAWSAGADGVYLFNYFNPKSPLWRELGDPAALRKLDRSYFVSVRGAGYMPVPHQKFIHVPTLNPANPISVSPQNTARIEFRVGENVAGNDDRTRIALRLQFRKPPEPQQLRGLVNSKELPAGVIRDGWLEFVLQDGLLRQGINTLVLSCRPQQTETLSLLDLYVEITQH
jgi:hypothetical protein